MPTVGFVKKGMRSIAADERIIYDICWSAEMLAAWGKPA